jgi:hypothetical protein
MAGFIVNLQFSFSKYVWCRGTVTRFELPATAYAQTLCTMPRGQSPEFSDRIIEIKYAKKMLSFEMIKAGVAHLNKNSQFYTKTYGRKVVPILFVVFSSETKATDESLRNLSQRARSEASDYSSLDRFNVYFVEESKIEEFDIKALLKR